MERTQSSFVAEFVEHWEQLYVSSKERLDDELLEIGWQITRELRIGSFLTLRLNRSWVVPLWTVKVNNVVFVILVGAHLMVMHKIKVDKQSIRTILTQFAPAYRVPSFQRRFVWDEEDIKELVDSIRKNYPIGAVIVWKPNKIFPSVPLFDSDGSLSTPTQVEYIIDGQQRLTSLILVKNNWRITRDGSPIDTIGQVSYNPARNRIEKGKRGADLSLILNAAMGDFNSSNELQKKYTAIAKRLYEDIGAKILNYEIPIYEIESLISDGEEDIVSKEMAEIFTRINSAGVKIGRLEMFLSFFAGGIASDPKMQITKIWEEYEKKMGLELEPFLRFVFSNMGVKQNELTKVKSFDQSLKNIKDQNIDFTALIDRTKNAIRSATALLESEIGIVDAGLLPSQNTLVPIFQYFYNKMKDATNQEKNDAVKWFIIGSFNGVYSSSVDRKIEEDLKLVSQSDTFPIEELMNHMHQILHVRTIEKTDIIRREWEDAFRRQNGTRHRMLLQWLLYRNDADDWAGNKIINNKVTAHHIFPQDYLDDGLKDSSDEEKEKLIHAFPNLTLVHHDVNAQIGSTPPTEYLVNFSNETLEKHFIPLDRNLWKISNYMTFLTKRAEKICEQIEQSLSSAVVA